MRLNTVDMLSMGASISTMIGLIIAIITLRYLYLEKKEKLEYEIKKAFLDGKVWTNEGDISGKDGMFFELSFSKAPSHRFSGNIICFFSDGTEDLLMFDFEKSDRKKITLAVSRVSRRPECILGKATVKFISPDLFAVTFSESFMPGSIHETYIFPIPIHLSDYEDLIDPINL